MNLRELRQSHGWSQARLATALEVARPTISQIETGDRALPPDRAIQVGRLLGYDGADLERVVGGLVLAHRGAGAA